MGLGAVELIMEVEDEFKIAILDAEAADLITVGNLVDVVYSRLRHNAQDPCPSQHGFYIVRRQIMSLLDIQHSKIKPDTKFEDIISRKNRSKLWNDLITSLNIKETGWLSLVRPKWMVGLVVLTIPIIICIYLIISTHPSITVVFIIAAVIAILGNILTIPFKQKFRSEFSHVKDLIKIVNTLDTKIWSKEDVFQKIKTITVKQLGVKESEVTLNSKFVDDLGL